MADILTALITVAVMVYLVQLALLVYFVVSEEIKTKKQFWKMLIPFSFITEFIDLYKGLEDE